ncbi:MAG: acyl-CoA dehydratase activase [Spirochaetota bacterium]|nr:acyl-CoA dehydratase activase [Spirochaetota bacterium]
MAVIGVDVGSLATKTVVIDENKGILSYNILRSGHDYKGAAEQSIKDAIENAGLERNDIDFILSTGYGRSAVVMSTMADAQVTEITCHAKGIHWLFPEARTIIDIGGQDSKVIGLDEKGNVNNFVMNDKCAAGTGRFLEVMATALSVTIQDMGDLIISSNEIVEVSSMCTVFAESEVISLFAKGHNKSDIAAGIADSIARRITGLVGQVGLKEKVAMSGGVAKNKGVVQSIEKRIGAKLNISEEPQIVGAIGAAIAASERIAK